MIREDRRLPSNSQSPGSVVSRVAVFAESSREGGEELLVANCLPLRGSPCGQTRTRHEAPSPASTPSIASPVVIRWPRDGGFFCNVHSKKGATNNFDDLSVCLMLKTVHLFATNIRQESVHTLRQTKTARKWIGKRYSTGRTSPASTTVTSRHVVADFPVVAWQVLSFKTRRSFTTWSYHDHDHDWPSLCGRASTMARRRGQKAQQQRHPRWRDRFWQVKEEN